MDISDFVNLQANRIWVRVIHIDALADFIISSIAPMHTPAFHDTISLLKNNHSHDKYAQNSGAILAGADSG
jgi:hypothetical protein